MDTNRSAENRAAPLVSVVVPAYNAAECIERALRSVFEQSMQDFEILVVDDCSTDSTAAIVEAMAADEPRIRLHRMPENGGPSAARNRGIEAATGYWISILDADDAYRPNRLQMLIDAATAHDLDMICDNIMLYDLRAGRDVRPADVPFGKGFVQLDLQTFLKNSLYLPPVFNRSRRQITQFALFKFCFRRDFLKRTGLRYELDYRDNEDFILYAECLIAGAKAGFLNEPLYVYTQGVGEISSERSGLTRTPRDRSLVVKAVNELLQRRGAELGEAEKRLLRRRASEARALQAFENGMRQLKAGHALAALRSIGSTPLALEFFLNEIARYAGKKLKMAR